MFEAFQDPETVWTIEDGKLVGRDEKGNVVLEASIGGSSGFHGINLSEDVSAHTTPQAGAAACERGQV